MGVRGWGPYSERATPSTRLRFLLRPAMRSDTSWVLLYSLPVVGRESGSCFARMPTLATMKLSRRWGTQLRLIGGVYGPAGVARLHAGTFSLALRTRIMRARPLGVWLWRDVWLRIG